MGPLTVRADAPERHLGLVEDEPVRRVGREARCRANDAVDVRYRTTRTTDDVMVVVRDPRFEERGAPSGLDPSSETDLSEHREGAVDRLGRGGLEAVAHRSEDLVDPQMVPPRAEDIQYRDPLRRDAQPLGPECCTAVFGHSEERTTKNGIIPLKARSAAV